MHERLGDLAQRDFARGQQHDHRDAGPRAVDGQRRRRVARRGAGHALHAQLQRPGDADGHAPVLERAGGVHALVLDVGVLHADVLADGLDVVDRRAALFQRHGLSLHREQRPVLPDGQRPLQVLPRQLDVGIIVDDVEQAPALPAGVDDLVGPELCAALDAFEMKHGILRII